MATKVKKAKETKIKVEKTKVVSTQSASTEPSTSSVKRMESFKAVLWAFLIGFILVIITGQTGLILDFFHGFIKENFSSVNSFTKFLGRLSYFIPLGLSLAVAFRMGLFNIGASGQALGGGAFAFYLSTRITFAGNLGWIVTLFAGVFFGMIVALIIAMLKNRFNINEVISSIMLNWVMFYFVMHISSNIAATTPLADNDLRMKWLNDFFSGLSSDSFDNAATSMNIGILFALPLVIVLAWAYKHTKWGFRQELIGNNPKTGKYLGVNSKKEVYKTMAISGALAGLAGTIYFLGVNQALPDPGTTNDIPGWTFDGITIALLGFSSPWGAVGSSIVYALFNPDIDQIVGGLGIVSIMVAVMIISIARSNYRIQYGKRQKVKATKKSTKGGGK